MKRTMRSGIISLRQCCCCCCCSLLKPNKNWNVMCINMISYENNVLVGNVIHRGVQLPDICDMIRACFSLDQDFMARSHAPEI